MSDSDEIIICRCEDVTLSEIRRAIEAGYSNFEELKRFLRIGMGPCQGRTCLQLVRNELARFHGKNPGDIDMPTKRPPAVNVLFGTIEKFSEKY